ncbi:MAG: murein transglycosylase [Thermomicrobiales bacterium]|nr:MAG: murein transglycosylase [Thermomicrobiales bacterium]
MRQFGWLVLVAFAGTLSGCGAHDWLDPGAVWLRWQSQRVKQEALHHAWQAWQHGHNERAYREFARLARAYAELADHCWYHAGLAAMRLGHPERAVQAMRRVTQNFPQSVFFLDAAAFLAEQAERKGELATARAWAARVLASAPPDELRQRASLVVARCDEREGAIGVAVDAYRRVWREARAASVREQARQALASARAAHVDAPPAERDRIEEAEWAVRDRDWRLAQEFAQPLLLATDTEVRARALLVLAEVAYGLGQWEDALTGWWAVPQRYPESRVAPAALYRMGTVLWNRNRDAAADRVFAELLRRYPAADEAPKAAIARVRIAYASGAPGRVEDLLRQAEPLVWNREAQRELFWWRGWVAYKQQNWAAAAAAFQRLGSDDERAQYWLARTWEQQGNRARAIEIYRRLTSGRPRFYADLARRRLSGLGSQPFRLLGLSVAPPNPISVAPPAGVDRFHYTRWQHLLAAGVTPLARKELAALAAAAPAGDSAWRTFLVAASFQSHAYADVLRRLSSWPDMPRAERERLEYPLAFFTLVDEAARAHRVDPLFLLAVMRQESLFDPEICSPAGACGLMQLLPGTAEQVATSLGWVLRATDLFDPGRSIALGARHLRELLDRFGDDPLLALAAYNGGEEAARRWAARTRGLPPDEFVEDITYRETRDYVKRVWTHYLRYQALYFGETRDPG